MDNKPSVDATEKIVEKSSKLAKPARHIAAASPVGVFIGLGFQDAFERSTDAVRSTAAKVLSRLPDFELRDDDLEQALQNHPSALEGIADSSKVKGMLKQMQGSARSSIFTNINTLSSALHPRARTSFTTIKPGPTLLRMESKTHRACSGFRDMRLLASR